MTWIAERRQSPAPRAARDLALTEPFADSRQQLLAAMAYIDLRVRWAVARARAQGLDPSDEFRGLYISEEHIDELLDRELGALWPDANDLAGLLLGRYQVAGVGVFVLCIVHDDHAGEPAYAYA